MGYKSAGYMTARQYERGLYHNLFPDGRPQGEKAAPMLCVMASSPEQLQEFAQGWDAFFAGEPQPYDGSRKKSPKEEPSIDEDEGIPH